MRKITLILAGLALVAGCESATQPLSSTVPDATMSMATTDLIGGFVVMATPVEQPQPNPLPKNQILIYGTGFFPLDSAPKHTWYKVYWRFSDGSRQLIGEDHHPLSVPTSIGPMVDGHQVSNGGMWTFVVKGQWPNGTPDFLWEYDRVVLDVEFWGQGGMITVGHGFLEI